MLKNYYKTLQVDISSTPSDIKEAYKKLALQYHPDKSGRKATEETFKLINEAYQVLADEKQRQQYNQKFLSSICYTEQFIQDPPVYYEVQISLEEIYNCGKKKVNLPKKIYQPDGSFRQETKEVSLIIIKGLIGGTRYTFPRAGDEKPQHIPADVIIIVVETPHPYFVRKGNDLHYNKKISYSDLLAKRYDAYTPLLNGRLAHIDMSNSTLKRHENFVAHGKGLPSSANGTYGDMIIHLEIDLPSNIQSITTKRKSFLSRFFTKAL